MTAARPAPRPRRPRPPAAPAPASAADLFVGVAAKQARLLSAALDLFVERGFRAATIPAIAARAGVATGTVYLYFDSKERLVNEVLARVKGGLAARLQVEVPRAAPVRAQFEAIWEVFTSFALAHERALAFCDLHDHASYITPGTLARWEPARRLLDAHFRRGRAEGVYRALPPGLLRALVAGALWGVHKFSRMGELPFTREVLAHAREGAWGAVAAPPPASGAASDPGRPRRGARARPGHDPRHRRTHGR